jgi:hypothetical protein
MRNSFEALCALAAREQWCWEMHCGTCGHGVFRWGLRALAHGAHPDLPGWVVRWGPQVSFTDLEVIAGEPPPFEGWPLLQQQRLQALIAQANIDHIADECPFPDWLGYLGLGLHYTEDAEKHNPLISREIAPQLERLVAPNSSSSDMLRARAAGEGAERLSWRDLWPVEEGMNRKKATGGPGHPA